jgi:GNAT superfamily N-acetyltransferase
MHNRDIERQIRDTADRASERARYYADGAASNAQGLLERGRRRIHERFGNRGQGYGRQLSHAAEDLADEANYHYRRLRRQVNRHPAATVAIVAGTIGAFLLLRRAFRSDED